MAKTTYTRTCLYCENNFDTFDKVKKYCNLSCSTSHRNNKNTTAKIKKYNLNPKSCLNCNHAIDYDKRLNIFCSSSCSAQYNNQRRPPRSIESRRRTADSLKKLYAEIKKNKTKIEKNKPKIKKTERLTKVKSVRFSNCVVCKQIIIGKRKTCGDACYSKFFSLLTRGKLGGNTDINRPGVDSFGKKFYFDSSWEVILAEDLTRNNILWSRPKRFILSNGRGYTPDFYIPAYNIYIDPKAKRPNYYRDSILKIEMFEKEYLTKCLVISNKKLLTWSHILTMLVVGNVRS